jgi:hypothetical protein
MYCETLLVAVPNTAVIQATLHGTKNPSRPRYLKPRPSTQHTAVLKTAHNRGIVNRALLSKTPRYLKPLTTAVSHTAVIEATLRGIQNRRPPRYEIPRLYDG